MRSPATQRRAVRRIAIGAVTLTLVGIGNVPAFDASWAPNRAGVDPSAVKQLSAESLGDDLVCIDGDPLTGNEPEQTADARILGSLAVEPTPPPTGLCCLTEAGSCVIFYASKCPSGGTQTSCPCVEPV